MARNQLRLTRGTTATLAAYTGPSGEQVFNTTTGRIHAQDGSTPGGIPMARLDESPGAPPPLVPGDDSLRDNMFPPRTDSVNMPAIRRRLRLGVADLFDWGLVPGSTGQAVNNVSKWNTAMTDLRTNGIKSLYVPPDGNWLTEGSVLEMPLGIRLFGDSVSTSVFCRLDGGDIIRLTGQYGLGARIEDLSFVYTGAFQGNVAIHLVGTSAYQPDFTYIRNINVSHLSGGLMGYCLLMDGTARQNGVSGLSGLRNIKIEGAELFNIVPGGSHVAGRSLRACRLRDVTAFSGGGAPGVMQFSCATGNSAYVSSNIYMASCYTDILALYEVSGWEMLGGFAGQLNITTAANGGFACGRYGAVSNANPGSNRVI